MVLFFGHDNTVGSVMAALNLTNWMCLKDRFYNSDTMYNEYNCPGYPTFASNIVWELYLNDDAKNNPRWFFKIKYNDQYRDICNSGTLECEFDDMYDLLFKYYKDDADYAQICSI